MASSPKELAVRLDGWAAQGAIGIIETEVALTLSNVAADNARLIVVMLAELGWSCSIVDAALEPAERDDLSQEFGPYIITVVKPGSDVSIRYVTLHGFKSSLRSRAFVGVLQIAACATSFATGLVSYNPWGGGDIFSPAVETKNPQHLVRDTSGAGCVPSDIRQWLLRSAITDALWSDAAFQAFAEVSCGKLIRSVSSEVPARDAVVFVGSPKTTLTLDDGDSLRLLGLEGYSSLQNVVSWVYEDPKAAEQRHTLVVNEVVRSAYGVRSAGGLFAGAGKDILESARLAYQLGLSDLSREAIKAQGDLRKAIADDTSKAADSTRTMATATAGAIGTAIGLIAARSSSTVAPWILSSVGVAVALYLIGVALSGWMFLRTQATLRAQWRLRFYRFIADEDYEAMVTKPADDAEFPYHLLATFSLVVAVMMLGLSVQGWVFP